ncbi:replicative DNA helicase [Methylibium petroleiphilum]|uniref:Putative replicative DNA helicase protein n=1 Tax=Methylibium petroleiphilum (strain ATCC BAA-1232 / LMG 22953 / PM1) TaxID=420662 RepID=A2SF22_METPP|nr:DnaB-like helicase C-terminal domain-containing protein [Methylibium petroleiphilum]ABM94161.1 putative replicative DNA helicase protein [Methylibium petroleiphilum PM1]
MSLDASARELLTDLIDRLSDRHDRGQTQDPSGLPTGFRELDQLTTGMHRGDLIVIAGRPSIGKSALALNVATHVAIQQGTPVLIFSMEMDGRHVMDRLVSSISRVDLQRVRMAQLSDDDWSHAIEAFNLLSDAPLVIDDTPSLSVNELIARANKRADAMGRLGLVVVDYMQLMAGGLTSNIETRAGQVGEISRGLKRLARELGCPVVALSQLGRSPASRSDKRPTLADLRDSGAIECDADVIVLLYRDDYTRAASMCTGLTEIIVGKQRNGPTGTVRLMFVGPLTTFESLAAPYGSSRG